MLHSGCIKPFASRHSVPAQSQRRNSAHTLRQSIQLPSKVKWQVTRKGKQFNTCTATIVAFLPRFILNTSANSTSTLGLAYLLNPEATSRAIEHAKQRKMIILSCKLWQLYCRRGLLEYLPAPI